MLSTHEMEATTEALEAGGQRFQLEALEERLAPGDCGGAAVALSTGAAVAISGDGGAAAAAGTAAGAAGSGCGGGAAGAVGPGASRSLCLPGPGATPAIRQ